ncbi:MAG: pyridoxal-phosphate dependent enzyme [Actinomycetota bacterium]|nr:pyridoxal-phosphate dependent enzyme [Actinomycetota bacterium]
MTISLVERFPGIDGLSRVALCDLPTPLETIESALSVGELWIKRDDLTSRAYGGNKVRKLEFLLGKALAEERRAVITFGAYGSNHALATAVHARAVGLEPHVVLSPQAPTPYARATLLAHAGLGTRIHLVEGWDGAREAVRVKRALEAANGVEPLVIPMGGTNALGAAGYVNAAFEVADEMAEPGTIYVAGGTLGTAVGLAIGCAAVGWNRVTIQAIRVTPSEVANVAFARTIAEETVALLREADADFPALAFGDLSLTLRDDWCEPGYGVVTPETMQAVADMGQAGHRLETTYTGKAFAALTADASRGELGGSSVLFWNTYNSAALPEPGPADTLPQRLQDYIAECDRLFG